MTFTTNGGADAGGLLTITGDAVISNNLTVQGTASFNHSENLLVADRFALFASGSSAAGDGGIVIQQGTQNVGDAFAFDGLSTLRWGITSSFNAGDSGYTPDAFMSAVVIGASAADTNATIAARYVAKGNIFVSSSQDIYIYS